jgi:hypothetical protein
VRGTATYTKKAAEESLQLKINLITCDLNSFTHFLNPGQLGGGSLVFSTFSKFKPWQECEIN